MAARLSDYGAAVLRRLRDSPCTELFYLFETI